MPESTINNQVQAITHYMEKVRSALLPRGDAKGERSSAGLRPAALTLSLLAHEGKLHLNTISEHLDLSRTQTLSVLQRLEGSREIKRVRGLWQLKNNR